jgi:hypothetical protein
MTATATPSFIVIAAPASGDNQVTTYAAAGGGAAAVVAGAVLFYIKWRARARKIRDMDSEVATVRSQTSKHTEDI